MIQKLSRLLTALALVTTSVQLVAQEKSPRSTALSPAESLAKIELEEGFEIKVIAHEPQVIDPVDAAFDDSGRLWVVEMRDYPYPTSDSPSGRVRILSDEDLDGHFEKSVVFAEQLDMPTGLALWKDGALITLAGQVVWFRDTDGDLKSDTQQVWIEGFAKENEQLRANHPRLGPDGWWYIASGLRGGNVIAGPDFRSPDDKPITLGSRDVRFNPQTKQLEAITGPAQFGLCFDSIGNRIFCSNRNPAVMVRFEQEDLVGNPLAGLIPSVVDLIPAGEQSKVFPLVNAWTTSNLHSGQFTAACGVFYHEFTGELTGAPDEAAENAVRLFVCEPTGSLVHSSIFYGSLNESVRRVGTKLKHNEWLASRDEWFRPVNLAQAPDGGVLIVDMHRAVIEHPAWVPDELKKRPDERWGNECGRVFHVTRKNSDDLKAVWNDLRLKPLRSRKSDELIGLLASKSPWLRESSRRLLIERGTTDKDDLLYRLVALHMVAQSKASIAGRVVAIELAAILGNEPPPESEKAYREYAGGVAGVGLRPDESNREIRLASLRVVRNYFAKDLQGTASQLQEILGSRDPALIVEYLRLLRLGKTQFPAGFESGLAPLVESRLLEVELPNESSLAELLVIISSVFSDRPEITLAILLNAVESNPSRFAGVFPAAAGRLAASAAEKGTEATGKIVEQASRMLVSDNSISKLVALEVIAEFENRRAKLSSFDSELSSDELWKTIRAIGDSDAADVDVRVKAIGLLAKSPRESDRQLLPQLAVSPALPLKLAALSAWASTADDACDEFLIQELPGSSPQLQQVILNLVSQKQERLKAVADQLTAGQITAKRIGSNELKKLVSRAKGDTQTKLNAALESIVNSDRAKVVTNYQSCLTMTSDALRGKEIFVKHCASCHKVADVGVQVGPDISDSRTQQPSQILTNILDPNRAIDNNYFRFVALTAEDQVIEGMIAEETSDAIVLRGQNNVRTTLKRADLQELKATGISLMPEGLESQIDPQAMADLISFIKNWRYLDGSIPK